MQLGTGAVAVAVGTLLASTVAIAADAWPTRSVRMVVTFPPGGSSDIVARLIGPPLGEGLGQSVVIDNRAGGGGTIGGKAVATARADGYTLMLSNTTPISISPFMMSKPPYDASRSFTHVFYIGSVPNVFVVHPSVPAEDMKGLVAWLKNPPKPINYGSGGIGSIGHIVGELFKKSSGARMEHVGYKGSSPMHNDLIGGHILVAVDSLPQNVPYFQAGKLRPIAVTSSARMKMAPQIPTVVELGMPGLVAENFLGVSGPAGLPPAVVSRLHAGMTEVMKRTAVTARFDELGIQGRSMSPAEFQTFVQRQVAAWAEPVKASGARLD